MLNKYLSKRILFLSVLLIGSCIAANLALGVQNNVAANPERSEPLEFENGDNYSGTVIAKLGKSISGLPRQDLLIDAPQNLKWSGLIAYASKTTITPEASQTKDYSGYSGVCSLIVRRRSQGAETVRTYPLSLSADDSILNIRFFPRSSTRVLLSIGAGGDRYSQFALYVLDLNEEKLRRITSELMFDQIEISPDSRYVVYLRGPDHLGDEVPSNSASKNSDRLCYCDVESGIEPTVASKGVSAAGKWSVTRDNVILYGALIASKQGSIAAKKKQPVHDTLSKPTILAYSLKTKKTREVIRDAWRPVSSPSGDTIAFYGSRDINKPEALGPMWETNPQGAALLVSNLDGNGRKPLRREDSSYADLYWQDDLHLLSVKSTLSQDEAYTDFTLYNATTSKREINIPIKVKSIPAGENSSDFYSRTLVPFSLLGWSNDRQTILVKMVRWGGINSNTGLYDQFDEVKSIDLRSKKIVNLFTILNSPGGVAATSQIN